MHTHTLRWFAWALAASSMLASNVDQKPIAFDELAKTFIAAHVPKGASAEDASYDAILKRDYAELHVGAFDLYFPVAFLEDKPKAEAFRDVAGGVCDFQAHWVDWLALNADKAKKAHDDFAAYRAWIAKWNGSALAGLAKEPNKDLFAIWKTDAATVDVQKRLHELMFSAADLALVPPDGKDVRVVFSPTRLDFMQSLAFSGTVDAEAKRVNWTDGASDFMQFWLGPTITIALEYAPWSGYDPAFRTGQPMNKIGPTVMVQHVVQQSTLALFWHCEPTTPLDHFESAFAIDMAIAVCGEANTIENAGSVFNTGGRTAPYSKFVPGGNPRGGTLPAKKADSLNFVAENEWRKGHGKDHFLEPLRNGQKSGAKEAKGPTKKDALANFLLRGEDGGSKYVVHAPFLGPHASEQEYPPIQFLIDYSEFFRSYKAAFAYWLQQHGDPSSADASKKKFAALVAALPKRGEKETWEDIVTRVYGTPISDKDGSVDTLEWRYLKWIANGK